MNTCGLLLHHVLAVLPSVVLVRGRVVVLRQVEAAERALVRDLVSGVEPILKLVLDQLSGNLGRSAGVAPVPCAVGVVPQGIPWADALGLVDADGVLPALAAVDGVVAGHLHDDRVIFVVAAVGVAADLPPLEALRLLVPHAPLRDLRRLGVVPLPTTPKADAKPFVGSRAETANRAPLRLEPNEGVRDASFLHVATGSDQANRIETLPTCDP